MAIRPRLSSGCCSACSRISATTCSTSAAVLSSLPCWPAWNGRPRSVADPRVLSTNRSAREPHERTVRQTSRAASPAGGRRPSARLRFAATGDRPPVALAVRGVGYQARPKRHVTVAASRRPQRRASWTHSRSVVKNSARSARSSARGAARGNARTRNARASRLLRVAASALAVEPPSTAVASAAAIRRVVISTSLSSQVTIFDGSSHDPSHGTSSTASSSSTSQQDGSRVRGATARPLEAQATARPSKAQGWLSVRGWSRPSGAQELAASAASSAPSVSRVGRREAALAALDHEHIEGVRPPRRSGGRRRARSRAARRQPRRCGGRGVRAPGRERGEVAGATGIARPTAAGTLARLVADGVLEHVELPAGERGY